MLPADKRLAGLLLDSRMVSQALFLDMIILLPSLFPELQNWMLHAGGGQTLFFFRNLMFYVDALVVGYATISNLRGKLPEKVPLLSNAVHAYVS